MKKSLIRVYLIRQMQALKQGMPGPVTSQVGLKAGSAPFAPVPRATPLKPGKPIPMTPLRPGSKPHEHPTNQPPGAPLRPGKPVPSQPLRPGGREPARKR